MNNQLDKTMDTINLHQKFARFQEHWTPKIIGELNGQYIKLAKVKDTLVWHSHAEEDELFIYPQKPPSPGRVDKRY